MKITITPGILCNLCNNKFSLTACEVICGLFEKWDKSPTIDDICTNFSEIPANCTDEYNNNNLVTNLYNGNVLVVH